MERKSASEVLIIFMTFDVIEKRTCMLLLLSRFSRVWLCATPKTVVHQAPPSLGFSRQEHWSGLPFRFSIAWKWKVKVKSLSPVWLSATPWTAAYQAPLSMGFSRQEYWSGVPLPSTWFTVGFKGPSFLLSKDILKFLPKGSIYCSETVYSAKFEPCCVW